MVGLVALGVSCQLMSGLSDLGLGDLATGTACTHPAQCQSEQCVDLVCCEVACDTDCVGCNLPGSEGICAPYEARTDPDGDCPGMGLCDGQGTCTAGNHNICPGDDTRPQKFCSFRRDRAKLYQVINREWCF